MAEVKFQVDGMACPLCAADISDAIGRMKGVGRVEVAFPRAEVRIRFEPREVMPAQLESKLLDLGFPVREPRPSAWSRRIGLGAAVVLVILVALALWQWQWDISALEGWLEQHALLGTAAYVAAVAASVVVLPFSSLPLLPFAVHLYGVVPTAMLSTAGWWIGSLVAFQIARLGRRYVERVTSLDALDRLEHRIAADIGFGAS